jgi:hypothetical protein
VACAVACLRKYEGKGKGKGKAHPVEGHEGPGGDGGRGILLFSLFNLGGRWWWLVNATLRPL